MMQEPFQQPEIIAYSTSMAASFRHWTGGNLIESVSQPELLSEALYRAPFVLLSHGMQADPVFCYANLAAQRLWQMDWERFVTTPSRLSAEPDAQEERERLILHAAKTGYVANYQGVRISSEGRHFRIKQCVLWNVLDDRQEKIGQAAMFDQLEWLP